VRLVHELGPAVELIWWDEDRYLWTRPTSKAFRQFADEPRD
jgi:hypothetical protein